jgi:DNA-binding MarR family transcriptional regulator
MKDKITEKLNNLFHQLLWLEEAELCKQGCKIPVYDVHILDMINNSEDASINDIVNGLHLPRMQLSIIVSRLHQQKYLYRYTKNGDHRNMYMEVTDSGKRILEIHNKFHRDIFNSCFVECNIEKEEKLLSLLEKFSKHIKNSF